MATEVYHPSHPDSSSGWVALTARAPWPVGERTLRIRDTALALAGGVGRSAAITLPAPAYSMKVHIAGANGTFTGYTITFRLVDPTATYVADAEPTFANDDTSGMQSSPTIVADTNEAIEIPTPPLVHEVHLRGGGGTATTCDMRWEVSLLEPYNPNSTSN